MDVETQQVATGKRLWAVEGDHWPSVPREPADGAGDSVRSVDPRRGRGGSLDVKDIEPNEPLAHAVALLLNAIRSTPNVASGALAANTSVSTAAAGEPRVVPFDLERRHCWSSPTYSEVSQCHMDGRLSKSASTMIYAVVRPRSETRDAAMYVRQHVFTAF